MPKETNINIRIAPSDKDLLQRRAVAMHMTLTEYLIHAGLVYEPSPKVQASLEAMTLAKQELEDHIKTLVD